MLLLQRPTEKQVRAFLDGQRGTPFSYAEVGASKTGAPAGPNRYLVDHNRIELGKGEEAFQLAVQAVQRWQMFNLGWVELFFADTPIEADRIVAILARHLGFYSLNASRIVYTIDEDAGVKRYGFAYGTLTEHAECGEERFLVEFDSRDNSVCYDLLAFSRPAHPLARLGYPLARRFQKRFARDSKRAMADFISTRLIEPV